LDTFSGWYGLEQQGISGGRVDAMTRREFMGETTMRTMSKSATAVHFDRGHATQAAPRATAGAQSSTAVATSRPANTLVDRVRTFVDRTLDAARGRYDM
jgi:hypothetical protein